MNKWLFHQNGFTRTCLSATVTRVSNFVEENVCVCVCVCVCVSVCVFYIAKTPHPGGFSHSFCRTQQVKYVKCNALSMFKALNKGCK